MLISNQFKLFEWRVELNFIEKLTQYYVAKQIVGSCYWEGIRCTDQMNEWQRYDIALTKENLQFDQMLISRFFVTQDIQTIYLYD